MIGFKTFCCIVGKPASVSPPSWVKYRCDAANQQLAPAPARQRVEQTVRDNFHQAAVAHKHIGEVGIDNFMIRLIKLRRQRTALLPQPDGVRQTLSKRTGGGFNTAYSRFPGDRGFSNATDGSSQFFQWQVVNRSDAAANCRSFDRGRIKRSRSYQSWVGNALRKNRSTALRQYQPCPSARWMIQNWLFVPHPYLSARIALARSFGTYNTRGWFIVWRQEDLQFALINGEQTNAFRCFSTAIASLIVLPTELRFASWELGGNV